MGGASGLFVVGFAGDVGVDAASFEVEFGALESFKGPSVDVDFHGGQVGLVVDGVDFVHFGNKEGDLAGLGEGYAVFFQDSVFLVGAVVEAAEAGFGEDVFHDADHAPGAMVVGADVVAGTPYDGGDCETIFALVELVGSVAGAGAAAKGSAVFLRDGVGVADEALQAGGAFVEEALLVGGLGEEGVHVMDEFFEGVFDGGHGGPPGAEGWRDGSMGKGGGQGWGGGGLCSS